MSLNLRELKETKISELVLMAQDLGVEEARGMRKHELIFTIFTHKQSKTATSTVRVSFRRSPMVSDFCARRTTTTSQAQTISTFLLHRFADLVCEQGTRSAGRFVPRRTESVILHS